MTATPPDPQAESPPLAGAIEPAAAARRIPLPWLYLVTLVLGLSLWAVAAAWSANALLPAPQAVLTAFWQLLNDGTLWANTSASLVRVVTGFVLGVALAIPAGFLMGWYWLARGLVEPWVQFLRTVPPLALIPLVIVVLGIGEDAKIFVIFLAAFLSCVLASYQGVRNVDNTLVNAARVLGAGDWTIFRRVVVPASMPFIFVGMRVALGASWATLVASELIAAPSGLGRMMQVATQFLQTDRIMVGIFMIGLLGFGMDRLLLRAERHVTAWQEVRT